MEDSADVPARVGMALTKALVTAGPPPNPFQQPPMPPPADPPPDMVDECGKTAEPAQESADLADKSKDISLFLVAFFVLYIYSCFLNRVQVADGFRATETRAELSSFRKADPRPAEIKLPDCIKVHQKL